MTGKASNSFDISFWKSYNMLSNYTNLIPSLCIPKTAVFFSFLTFKVMDNYRRAMQAKLLLKPF